VERLVLGTVQFGLPYGIANRSGQSVPIPTVKKILQYAFAKGVGLIDTAYAYGESEKVLGEVLVDEEFAAFKVITKTLSFFAAETINALAISQVEAAFTESLARLKKTQVYGLMVHHADDLLKPGGEKLYQMLMQWKALGKVQKIGCSFYSPRQLEQVLERYSMDMVQVPINLFDQRFLQNNLLLELQKNKTEIYARSLFLQGLLLTEPDAVPQAMAYVKPLLTKLKAFCQQKNISVLRFALSFAQALQDVYYVMGFQKLEEFQEVIDVHETHMVFDFSEWAVDDECVVNPTKWPVKKI
jgi:aryl-alcohol dehydrogenase-like predicted oxidoreductase